MYGTKYKGDNYYDFLNKIDYAENRCYISKFMNLERSLFPYNIKSPLARKLQDPNVSCR